MRRRAMSQKSGFTLVETLVTLVIFSVVFAGAYSAYITQLSNSTREYNLAESEVDLEVARSLVANDLYQAGYGLAYDYDTLAFSPRSASATDSTSGDTLTLMGTSLSLQSRTARSWTFVQDSGSFQQWTDPRERLRTDADDATKNDVVILMEPNNFRLINQGGDWLFRYNGATNQLTNLDGTANIPTQAEGTLVYGLQRADETAATQPYYAVRYYLGNTSVPGMCAPGTSNLLRAESRTSEAPTGGTPIMACLLDFQVAFGLDTDEDGAIDTWDNGGTAAALYDASQLRKNLKQIRLYALVQSGGRDAQYTWPSAEIRVGETSLGTDGTGRDINLTSEQRKYRWRMVTMKITPRNIR